MLAHPAGDELGVLGTEIDNENGAARGHRHSVVRTTNWGIGSRAWNDVNVPFVPRAVSIVVAVLMMSVGAPAVSASTPPDPTVPEAPTSIPVTPDTVNDFLDLERDLTTCISSNPLPGCGREPTSPGDRGGWQQLLLFGIMLGGMAIIFVRVYFSVRSRDRRRA